MMRCETRNAVAPSPGVLDSVSSVTALESEERTIDIDDIDFPPNPDDWGRDKKMCLYFDAEDESKVCTSDPEYFIKAYCADPGCETKHIWYYCLRHFASNIGYLTHVRCRDSLDLDVVKSLRKGEIPIRFQILGWGRIGVDEDADFPD